MDRNFWLERWENNEIAFHEGDANRLLVKHFGALDLKPGCRVFVPLCGKTLDISWLLANGYRVAGAELSIRAVEELFEQLGIQPTISQAGKLTHYAADGIDIFLGDIFDLTAETLGAVDAVYDRAALVALPEDMRQRYAVHLMAITQHVPQFVICFTYNQQHMPGPPFSVPKEKIEHLYGKHYHLIQRESVEVPGQLKGKVPATEDAWLLQREK